MVPIPKHVFRRRLRDLPEEGLGDFVAALWRARGREVTRGPGFIFTTDPASGATERLWLPSIQDGVNRSESDAGVDRERVVVTANPVGSRLRPGRQPEPAAVDSVTSDDLYQLLHFALDAQTADQITTEYFGIPFHRTSPSENGPDRSTPTTPDPQSQTIQRIGRSVRPAAPSRGLVLAGVTLLLLAGVLGVAAIQNGPPDPTVGAESGHGIPSDYETPTAIPDPAEESAPLEPSQRLANTTGDGFRIDRPQTLEAYPPGLGPGGIVDADVLATNHTAALRNETYILEITHREFRDGQPTGLARETITVTSPREYVAEVGRVGALRNDPLVIADASAFADGQYRYERLEREGRIAYLRKSPELLRDGLSGRDRYLTRAAAYIGWFLSVEDSWIAGVGDAEGTRVFWVVTEGESFPGYPNARGSAVIDEHGVVHEFTRTYDDQGVPGGEIQITLRYIQIGEAAVHEPHWAAQARAEVGPQTETATMDGPPGNGSTSQSADSGPSGETETATG